MFNLSCLQIVVFSTVLLFSYARAESCAACASNRSTLAPVSSFVHLLSLNTLPTITTFKVELAKTYKEQAKGLMHRKTLPSDSGMLFLFDDTRPRWFWMKNTQIPLDIIFFDAHFRVVHIAKNTKPFSLERIHSKVAARYVLEINAHLADRHKISVGVKAKLVNNNSQRTQK